jgi:NADPH:quinone reductase-like Zn-dependent oxidoreductase
MRAIIIQHFCGLDNLVIKNLPDPVAQPGSVLIEVKAFGINHAETHMRKGEWAEAATVSGIECVGSVKSCPGGEFAEGTKVAAFMGGLGRTMNGSYAEYTCPPATNVVAIKTDLPWEDFAVIPDFTFFGSFFFGTPDFPVSDVPLQASVDKAAAGIYRAKPARVFQFDEIREAHEAMESNQANGKMVIRI